ATSPQKTSNHSIRFTNLDLLFGSEGRTATLVKARSSIHSAGTSAGTIAVPQLRCTQISKASLFPERSVARGRRTGRVADLPVKHRPVLAQHVPARFGCQIQTIPKEGSPDGAVPIRQ